MRVVLSGYYGFDNVGDEAILYSIIQALREEDAKIEIVVLSNQPAKTADTYGVEGVNRWNLPEVMSAIRNSDGLISGGGSLLQDETGFKSIPYYTGVIKIAQLLGKPVFVYAQGMGPINKGFNRHIVKSVLKGTKITVRDEASKELLKEIGIKKEIDIVPDPVLGLTLSSQESTWWEQQTFSEPVITVSVRNWPSSVDFKAKIAKGLDLVSKTGATIVFVPMHGEHDDKASKEVADLMLNKYYIAPYDASIEEKMFIIGKSNLLFGMRLHALIFASVMNTPSIALSYDPKIDAFAEISGQSVAGHVNDNSWDTETLFQMIKLKLDKELQEVQKLQDRIIPLREDARKTAHSAIRYFM